MRATFLNTKARLVMADAARLEKRMLPRVFLAGLRNAPAADVVIGEMVDPYCCRDLAMSE